MTKFGDPELLLRRDVKSGKRSRPKRVLRFGPTIIGALTTKSGIVLTAKSGVRLTKKR